MSFPRGGLFQCAHAHPWRCSPAWPAASLHLRRRPPPTHSSRTPRRSRRSRPASSKALGFDVQEGGADGSAVQDLEIVATDKEVARLAARGIEVEALAIDKPVAKSAALGDSPNPFFNVYRSYMEPGGIADEMRASRPPTRT